MEAINAVFHSPWYPVVSAMLQAATLAAMVTPNHYDNLALKCIRAVIDVLAGNLGNAENKKK